MLGFSTLLILLQMKSRKLKNVYFSFCMGRLITKSRLIISDASCSKNPLKRLYPSWSLCHKHVLVELSIHSANTTKSRFGVLVPEQWDWMRRNGDLPRVKTTLKPPSEFNPISNFKCLQEELFSSTVHLVGVKCSAIYKVCEDTPRQKSQLQ